MQAVQDSVAVGLPGPDAPRVNDPAISLFRKHLQKVAQGRFEGRLGASCLIKLSYDKEWQMTTTEYIPAGWPAVIPRIAVDDPEDLVAFIRDVFAATGSFHPEHPSELRIGDSMLMIGSTLDRKATNAFLYVYVPDADTVYRRALEHGAKSVEEPQDMPYGDRRAMVQDRWGNSWQIATHRGRFSS
jgi:PhnB protein